MNIRISETTTFFFNGKQRFNSGQTCYETNKDTTFANYLATLSIFPLLPKGGGGAPAGAPPKFLSLCGKGPSC